jgi:hypothetical protein
VAESALPGLTSSIEARPDGLGHILRDHRLAVPVYQRSYAWNVEQVQQYVGDLQAALGSFQPSYFMGTVVLTASHEGDRLTIIDGQQRLATTVLLLAAIRSQLVEAGEDMRAAVLESQYLATRSFETNDLEPRLALNAEDRTFFDQIVLTGEAGAAQPERQSHQRIAEAFNALRTVMAEEVIRAGPHWRDMLFRWVSFIDAQVQVIRVVADNDADAFLLFETLNDRGKDLTVVDLLKNHLFGLARNQLELVQGPWLEAVEALDAEEDQAMTAFVRHYWSSINGATRERELYRDLKRYVRSTDQAVEFVDDLRDSARYYAALLNPEHEYWAQLGPRARDAAGILLGFGLEQNRPLLLAAMDAFDVPELSLLIEALVVWSVRGLVVGGIGGGTTERYYTEAAQGIRRGRVRTTEDVFGVIRPIVASDEDFRARFEVSTVYRLRTATYLLLALERHSAGGEHPALPALDERSDLNAEAILPRSANPAEWPGWTPEQVSTLSRRLGNFALVPAGQHLTGGWVTRRAVLERSQLRTNELPADVGDWDPDAVRHRQAEFAEQAIQVWPLLG